MWLALECLLVARYGYGNSPSLSGVDWQIYWTISGQLMDKATQKPYRDAWLAVSGEFQKGYCVSERGLQAVLASELRKKFPEKEVVIEPFWKIGDVAYIPDLVLINDMKISDIFELKFVPHS